MKNNRIWIIVFVVVALLSIPLIAMQFTDEVNWGLLDFVVMGALLFGTGLLVELVLRNVKTTAYRVLTCGVIFVAFFLIWAELAVGIFGTPFAGS